MKTIGAKELRLHLDQVLDRVLKGEDVVLQHRFKGPVRLSALQPQTNTRKPLAGLHAFEAASKKPSPFDSKKSVKEIYRESIANKYAS